MVSRGSGPRSHCGARAQRRGLGFKIRFPFEPLAFVTGRPLKKSPISSLALNEPARVTISNPLASGLPVISVPLPLTSVNVAKPAGAAPPQPRGAVWT